MRRIVIAGWVLFLLALTPPVRAESIFEDLARLVPGDANLLVLIDSEKIRRSEFHKQQKLDAADAEQDGGRQVFLGPQVTHALLASKIRGFRSSQMDWELALLGAKGTPSVANVALTYGGSLEQLGTLEYATLTTGAMAFSSGPKTLAILSPADRPRANRIINLAKSTNPAAMSAYLKNVYQTRALGADAVLALDLEGLLSHSGILRRLQDSKTFKETKGDVLAAQKLIAGVRGLTLRVKLRAAAEGELTIDFADATDGAAPWAKELFIEFINEIGAAVDELPSWSMRTAKNQLIFEGPLSLRGLRQIFSLVSSPTDIPAEFDPKAVLTPEQEKLRSAKASLNRYRSTQKLLDDLRDPANTKNLTGGSYGMWFEKYAKKIEQLPSLHVDPEVLAYCDDVVMRLRIQATRYRMVGIKAGQYSQNPNYVLYYYGNWYGAVGYAGEVDSDATHVRKLEAAAAAGDKFAQFQAIDKAALELRRLMTQRYQIEF